MATIIFDKLAGQEQAKQISLSEVKLPKSLFPLMIDNPYADNGVDEIVDARLFVTSDTIVAYQHDWRQILVTCQKAGESYLLTLYLTHNTDDIRNHGPQFRHKLTKSKSYKSLVRSLFKDYDVEVRYL